MATITQNVDTAPFWPRPFWPPRNWWLALLVILVLAGALRYPGYDFSLPLVEHVGHKTDEVFYTLAARMIIDTGTAKSQDAHHYPPGIIALNYVALRLFHGPTAHHTGIIGGMRLLSISVSLAAIVILALLGYHLGGAPAGLFSAGLWAITPAMVNYSRYSAADIYVTCFTLLALWLTLVGTLHKRAGWTTAGTYALMLAIVFKYQAVSIAPMMLFAPLIHGRRAWRNVLGNLGRFALFSAWLILLTPVLEAFQNPENASVPHSWISRLAIDSVLGAEQLLAGIRNILANLDLRPLLPGWLGLVLLARERSGKKYLALFLIVLSMLSWYFSIALFDDKFRFLLAPVSMAILFAGIGYGFWWRAAGPWLARFGQFRWLPAAAALVALALLNLPNLQASVADLRDKMLPDQRNDLAVWADGSLPASKYITNINNNRTLNSSWGGYTGETHFDYAGFVFSDTTIAEWRTQDVLFAIVPHFQYELWREDGVHEFVTKTTLLKSYPSSDEYRNSGMVVLLLYPIQHEATGQLGPIRLLGYDLPAGAGSSAGQSLHFYLYWQAEAATATNYQVFNHLLDAEGRLVAQTDGPPLPSERRGTIDWSDPEEIIYSRQYALALPEDLPSGEYTLVTGFYRLDSGQRLLTPTGEDSLYVTTISIE